MPTTVPQPRPATRAPADPRTSAVRVHPPAAVWWRIYLHHLRLLRGSALAWIVALAGLGTAVAATFGGRYSTEAELGALAEMEGVPAFEALVGRYVEIATVEGLVLSRWGMFAVLVAVWGMLTAGRLLRGAEETGHAEPLRAAAVTPRGLLGAVLAAILTVHAAFAVVIGLSHSAAGMDAATSWAVGAAMGLLAATFAAAGALACQVAASRRRAMGLVGAVLGVALGVRLVAAASGTPDWLWWATPFGWIGFLHEVDRARTGVFVSFVTLLVVLLVAAFATARRHLHSGVVGDDGTSAAAARPVRGQAGLAVRLTAGSATAWGVALTAVALVFGLLARDFGEAVAATPTTVEFAARLGWPGLDTPEGMVAFTFSLVALLLAVFAAGQASAIREEEATLRIEHLLVRPLGRVPWLATRMLVSAAAVLVLALAASLGAWAGTAVGGGPVTLADALLAGLNVVPVAWLVLGVGVALLGLLPRLTAPLTYGLVLAAYLLDFVGGMLGLPEAALDLSPFRHLAPVPFADVATVPTLAVLAVAALAAGVGLGAFAHRDLQEA